MQKMHIAYFDRSVVFYDLDFVISVGYRIKSLPDVLLKVYKMPLIHLIRKMNNDVYNIFSS